MHLGIVDHTRSIFCSVAPTWSVYHQGVFDQRPSHPHLQGLPAITSSSNLGPYFKVMEQEDNVERFQGEPATSVAFRSAKVRELSSLQRKALSQIRTLVSSDGIGGIRIMSKVSSERPTTKAVRNKGKGRAVKREEDDDAEYIDDEAEEASSEEEEEEAEGSEGGGEEADTEALAPKVVLVPEVAQALLGLEQVRCLSFQLCETQIDLFLLQGFDGEHGQASAAVQPSDYVQCGGTHCEAETCCISSV